MSAERCNCGTHTKAACDFAGACRPVAATLPAAPAPTEQQDELPITRSTYGSLEACEAEQARRNAAPSDFLMPEDAWNEYATRSGLLNEHGVAPHPATAQVAYFAYQAAWNCLHKAFSAYIAARPAPTEAPKEATPTCWIDPIELRELENGTVAMVVPIQGDAQRIPLFRQAPDGRDAEILDWIERHCTGASDSERYLPFRIYWGNKGATKGLRHVVIAAIAKEKAQ